MKAKAKKIAARRPTNGDYTHFFLEMARRTPRLNNVEKCMLDNAELFQMYIAALRWDVIQQLGEKE